jgi:hypothetical protein
MGVLFRGNVALAHKYTMLAGRAVQTASEGMDWVPHTSVVRVGFLNCRFTFYPLALHS